MTTEELIFNTNWNKKLDCDFFTSIRINNDRKFVVGNKYVIKLGKKDQPLKTYPRMAVLIAKHTINLAGIKDYMAYLDTGYNAEETKELIRKIYRFKIPNIETKPLDYLLFGYINESSEQQAYINFAAKN